MPSVMRRFERFVATTLRSLGTAEGGAVAAVCVVAAFALAAMLYPMPPGSDCYLALPEKTQTAMDDAVRQRETFAVIALVCLPLPLILAAVALIRRRPHTWRSVLVALLSVTLLPVLELYAWLAANPCGLT